MTAHTIIFAPIEQATRTEQVLERLENAIISGLLKHHEQLPSEADLARLLGVSPITVRDALNTLRGRGLIDTRRGRNGGSFVCEISSEQRFSQHPLHQASQAYLADLGELHSAILAHSSSLAVQRSTKQEFEKLKQAINSFAQSQQAADRLNSDMQCVLQLCALAQSSRLTSQELLIQAEWAPLISIVYQEQQFHAQMVAQYQVILNSFILADAADAALQAQRLVQLATDQMLRYKLAMQQHDSTVDH